MQTYAYCLSSLYSSFISRLFFFDSFFKFDSSRFIFANCILLTNLAIIEVVVATKSLCTLEWLSHNGLSVSGFSYYKFSIEIPDELIVKYISSDLPKEWKNTPSPNLNRDFAAKNFYAPNQYLAMAIPSVMVPGI